MDEAPAFYIMIKTLHGNVQVMHLQLI